jgi:hypothetical protein
VLMREKFGLSVVEEKRVRRAQKRWAAAGRDASPPRQPRETTPLPAVCTRPTCPNPGAPALPGRAVCAGCADHLEQRAAQLVKEREERAA